MLLERRGGLRIRYRGAPAAEQRCQQGRQHRHSRQRIRATRAHTGSVYSAMVVLAHRALKTIRLQAWERTVRSEAERERGLPAGHSQYPFYAINVTLNKKKPASAQGNPSGSKDSQVNQAAQK